MTNPRLLTALAALAASSALAHADPVIVLGGGNQLTTIDSQSPGSIIRNVTVALPNGETLVSLESSQPGRVTYGLSNAGNYYAINSVSGAFRPSGYTFTPGTLTDKVNFARDPATGLPINVPVVKFGPNANFTGAPTAPAPFYPQGTVAPGGGTLKAPQLGGLAFSNANSPSTANLYEIDVANRTLVTFGGVPYTYATGSLQIVGATGVATTPNGTALDINRANRAIAVFTNPANNVSGLYDISLASGQATLIGTLPNGGLYTGLAFALPTLQSYGFTTNTQNFGGILDTLVLSNNARAQALIGSVDAQTTADGQNAQLLALSPAAFQGLTQMTLQSLHFQDVTVRRYLRDVRQGGTEAGEQAVTYGSDRHYGMWFTGSGRTGFIKAGADRYRQSYGDYAFTGGLDYRFARGTLLGLFGGYDEGQTRLNPNSPQTDAKTWFAGGYGSATVGPVYIDLEGTYGRTRFNTRRVVADGFGGGFQYSSANGREPKSEQYQGAATAGISQDFRGVELEPYVGAKYAHITQRSFSEGTDAGALSLDRLTTVSIESIAGLRLGIKVPLTSTAVLRPTIRGEYRHEFRDAAGARDLNGTFSDGEGGLIPIAFRTTPLPRDYAAVGAGFTISGNSPFSIVLDYNGEYGGQRRINGITGGFHLAF